jgi:hypothetical protein
MIEQRCSTKPPPEVSAPSFSMTCNTRSIPLERNLHLVRVWPMGSDACWSAASRSASSTQLSQGRLLSLLSLTSGALRNTGESVRECPD